MVLNRKFRPPRRRAKPDVVHVKTEAMAQSSLTYLFVSAQFVIANFLSCLVRYCIGWINFR